MTPPPLRSMFVTALAWAFIGLGALGTCFFALFSFVTKVTYELGRQGDTPMQRQMQQVNRAMDALPAPWPWLYAHQSQLMLLVSALALLHLGCALGLLWRRPWARLSFIALLLIDALLQLAMLLYAWFVQPVVSRSVLASMQTSMPVSMPPAFATFMERAMAFQQIEALLRPLLLIAVFGWIAWRLCRPSVRQEFTRAAA